MPALLEPAMSPGGPAQDRQSTLARRFAVSAARFVLIAGLAALLGGGWYLAKKGFGRQWRHYIAEELRKHGVEASIRRLTLDPFRGLIAKDVRIFDYKDRENTLAVISEVSLDINYAALLHRQPFLNALDVRNAELTLPLKGLEGKINKAQLKNFRAHIYFPPEQIYVSQAEGIFCGVRVSATGQLIKRRDYQPSKKVAEENWQDQLSILQRTVEELQKFRFFSRSRPSLQIKFSGDLAQLENARVEATLRGARVRRGKYEMRDLFAAAEWADQTLTIAQCGWRDGSGALSGHATWGRQTNEANFQARSSLELKSFLEAFGFGEAIADATFHAPPVLELSGSANFGSDRPAIKIIGRAAIENFAYRGVALTDLSADFSWDGERTLVRDLRLRHESGQLSATLFDAPNDFRLNIDSTINPGLLRPFVSTELSQFLKEWEWQRPPTVHLAVRAQNRNPANWRGHGSIELGRTRFRGIWMNQANADVRFENGAFTCENLRVARDEGVGTGAFTYDFVKHEVRVADLKSSLRPTDAIFWIEPQQWKNVVPYKFRHPPNITASGVYQFRGGKSTRLEIAVDAPTGMDYQFLGKVLPFDRVSGKLLFVNDRLQLVDLSGTLFSGTVRAGAEISLAPGDPNYQAKVSVKGIDFPKLTDLYYQYKTSRGEFSGTYDFTGLGSDPRAMKGRGKVEVTNGDVFAIPIFGPISEILNAIVPGSGYSIARKASATFTIKDGIIRTDDFDAGGRLFGMLGHGDIHFLDDKLDFDLRINPNGPAVLLTPVYKLFEYKGEGSLKKPEWHPKRF